MPHSSFRYLAVLLATTIALSGASCSSSSDSQASKGGPMELRISEVAGEPYGDVSGQHPGKAERVRQELSAKKVEAARQQVYDKLGKDQVSAAKQLLDDPLSAQYAEAAVSDFKPWGKLSPEEVAVLPASLQFQVPAIGCQQLNARDVTPKNADHQQFAACQQNTKFLVKETALTNKDVDEAEAHPAKGTGGWMIGVTFSDSGAKSWRELAEAASNKQVAVVVDGAVISAPQVQPGAASGHSIEISGDFDQAEAKRLASRIVP